MNVTATYLSPSRAPVALTGFVTLSLLLLLVPASFTEQLRVSCRTVLQPLIRAASSAPGGQPLPANISVHLDGQGANPNETASPRVLAELEQARAQLTLLQDRIRKLEVARPQNAELREPPGVNATVIARRAIWQEPVLGIDKGTADGVRVDAGALFRGAVAGRVVAAGPRASSVALLTHPGMSIGARLLDSRVEGILQGTKAIEGTEHLCRLQIVAKDLRTQPGERVVTSGLDGVFPPGLWLGTVVRIKKSSGFQWDLDVQPACDESRIESVHVLTVQPPDVPWPVGKK